MHYSNASILESVAADKQNLYCRTHVLCTPTAKCCLLFSFFLCSDFYPLLLPAPRIYIYTSQLSHQPTLLRSVRIYSAHSPTQRSPCYGPTSPQEVLSNRCLSTAGHGFNPDTIKRHILVSVVPSLYQVTCRPGYDHVLSALWVFAIFLSCMLYRLLVSI